MIKRLLNSETLSVLYISLFSLLAPLTHTFKGFSTAIIVGSLVLILGLQIITNKTREVVSDYSFFFKVIFIIGVLFSFDYVLRPNSDITELMYSFIVYGFFTLYFLSSVFNYDIFLRSYCFFSILCGLMMLGDPLQDYAWSGGYMPFGFQFMLPAFSASIVLLFHYHLRSAILLVLIFFMAMLMFANKSSILAALILVFVGATYIKNGNHITRNTFFVLIITFILLYQFYSVILDFAILVANKLGVGSYALSTIKIVLEDTSDNYVYDTRLNIWKDAFAFFTESPLIGRGIGAYSSQQRYVYEHNLFLEVLNAWGVAGILLLSIVIYKSFRNFLSVKTQELKVLIIVFAILSFVPLMYSLTFWVHQPFWIFLALSFKSDSSHYIR